MPQSLANVLVHSVFSTSERRPLIREQVRPELYAYTGGILRNLNCQPVQIGGVADHIHVLFRLARTISIAEAMEKTKKGTSKWIKTQADISGDFSWQAGYGAFSVSREHEESVAQYIREQEAHHRSVTFQDELRTLLREAGLEFDERYLWD